MFTTMARELGRDITVDEVKSYAARELAEVFGLSLDRIDVSDLNALERTPLASAL